MSSSLITSLTAKRPPGRRTRAASRSTAALSAERLMTHVLDARVGRVTAGEGEHLVGHVEADRLAARSDSARRDQDVRPGAAAEVEDDLALGGGSRGLGIARADAIPQWSHADSSSSASGFT
jgi:hypothetical protein